MADLLFVLVVAAFFSLATLFVRACRAITGDEQEGDEREGGER